MYYTIKTMSSKTENRFAQSPTLPLPHYRNPDTVLQQQ